MPEHDDAEVKRRGGGDGEGTVVDVDEWGLPIRTAEVKEYSKKGGGAEGSSPVTDRAKDESTSIQAKVEESKPHNEPAVVAKDAKGDVKGDSSNSDDDDFQDASSIPLRETAAAPKKAEKPELPVLITKTEPESEPIAVKTKPDSPAPAKAEEEAPEPIKKEDSKPESPAIAAPDEAEQKALDPAEKQGHVRGNSSVDKTLAGVEKWHKPEKGTAKVSEWSHQQAAPLPEKEIKEESEDEWQTMPAYAPFDMYDDDNRLVAREAKESDEEDATYAGLGGAGKGYTRVQLDEDAQSATSMDDHTSYLFKEAHGTSAAGQDDDEQRDAVSQMQATKDLLTEGQRIAYVGMTRLVLSAMVASVGKVGKVDNAGKSARREVAVATEAMRMWSQKMMIRLYAHMDISTPEQIMIEQLAEHGVEPRDLTPTLMQNARVRNPMADAAESVASAGELAGERSPRVSVASPRVSVASPRVSVASPGLGSRAGEMSSRFSASSSRVPEEEAAAPPPPYVEVEGENLPEVRTPGQLPTTKNLDIDLRWTVLCDLFLTLVADSVYDARSRVLLEQVGSHLDVTWLDICRFEKRVTDALEMQQASEKENWNEDEHKENRRKMALKKRYMMMGLATVGGGLVIGLSAGLLAPVIGAGLAAGFTTIGVAGTSGFLAGAGGAAIITSAAATSGGVIAVRAANRRTGAVKTFEYRPLHNNKRVNLIVTVSGWMTGKVDDVRLPYSTVDPVMGDIYSVLWEPEMLTSMGDTINILATEALTQGLQQVLGNTILIGLMAAAQLPLVLTKLSYLIDNPWTVSLGRAEAAGLILADSLIDRNLGTRPVTFVGYSLGSRVIFSCLRELARKGAHGLVQNVYLFGSPMVAKRDDYLKARAVVAGRFVNGYARNDWILGYLFRLTSGGISRIAGLAPVNDIPGLENVDVTELVPGHMAYRTAMPRLLREVGWLVESDEFTEIEDPDPENHQQRQRELIDEIEEARKDFDRQEREAKGGAFAFLRRKKKSAAGKKEWETYEESRADPATGPASADEERLASKHDSVLFDIDAIRAELASEHLEVRELPTTLPPMKLDLGHSSGSAAPALRDTKSADAVPTLAGYGNDAAYKSYHASPYAPPDEPVQMSFDTAYVASPSHSPGFGSGLAAEGSPLGGLEAEEAWADEPRRVDEVSPRVSRDERDKPLPPPPPPGGEARPGLKPSWTEPLPGGNAWAEESDDEEFREKEMEMTFA